MLIVNTASKCGLTPQYRGLQEIYSELGPEGLVVIGFPCDQFANQEPGDDDQIKEFCEVNYGVSFPLSTKVDVNGSKTHPRRCCRPRRRSTPLALSPPSTLPDTAKVGRACLPGANLHHDTRSGWSLATASHRHTSCHWRPHYPFGGGFARCRNRAACRPARNGRVNHPSDGFSSRSDLQHTWQGWAKRHHRDEGRQICATTRHR